jgi:hypothetical protein
VKGESTTGSTFSVFDASGAVWAARGRATIPANSGTERQKPAIRDVGFMGKAGVTPVFA